MFGGCSRAVEGASRELALVARVHAAGLAFAAVTPGHVGQIIH